jgi:hypothetical protein
MLFSGINLLPDSKIVSYLSLIILISFHYYYNESTFMDYQLGQFLMHVALHKIFGKNQTTYFKI